MQTLKRFKALAAAAALLALCAPIGASTTYSQSITSSTSSLTITQAQHGFSSVKLAVVVTDANGNQLPTTAFSYSINSSTYAVSLTFSPAVSSGAVKLIGPYNANTSASTDWLVSRVGAPPYDVYVCYYCTSAVPAIRTTAGKSYVSEGWVKFTYNSGNLSHVYVYLKDNVVVMGVKPAA